MTLLLFPLLMGVAALLARGSALCRIMAWLGTAQLVLSAAVCVPHLQGEASQAWGFVLDGTSAVFLLLTTVVFTASLWHAPGFFARDHEGNPRTFYLFATLFVVTMYGVVAADNLGYLWISMEATTLVSAPLVYYHRSRTSLEAAWKYLLICSVAIAFAFFGTALLYSASEPNVTTLSIAMLRAHARELSAGPLRIGFIFILLGYGTKAGLFPLHNWLPDAHSEAPSPASAILSGAMLNCALVPLWRVGSVMAAAGDARFVTATLLPMGVLTVLAASLFLLKQHDLKRLLAYSSMENAGLMAVAVALGSSGGFSLQACNHSLVKVALFLMAGNLVGQFETKELHALAGTLSKAPMTAALLLAGGVAVAGTPPFGSFLAEWQILTQTVDSGHLPAAVVLCVALAIAFIAIGRHLAPLLLGKPATEAVGPTGGLLVPTGLLAASLVLGTALTPHLYGLAQAVLR